MVRGGGKQRARAREYMEQSEGIAAEESMRGEAGTHESKRKRMGADGQKEWEAPGAERTGKQTGAREHGAAAQEQTAEVTTADNRRREQCNKQEEYSEHRRTRK